MQSQTQVSPPATEEELSAGNSETTAEKVGADIQALIAPAAEAIVEVELNFIAFADHVPPTQHAKRVATGFDPSIQDFADQALEVSALRAELNRIGRECDALRKTLRLRESLVQTLREQLASSRAAVSAGVRGEEPLSMRPEASRSQAPVTTSKDTGASPVSEPPALTGSQPSVAHTPAVEHDGSSTIVLETAPHDLAATITNMPQVRRDSGTLESTPGRKLLPERHDGQAILLNQDVITIGRTRENDICIPSHAVSRDHARLLVGASYVTLFDMDSANGCFVNDEPIKRHKLRDGDRVRIGDRSYRFVDHVRGTRVNAP